MEYNYFKIGERLKAERKNAGFKSHDTLCDYIQEHNYRSFTRQTIAKWEKGLELPPLDVLCTLCVPFKCEVGYLLCEYDCKTRENTDIKEAIGLSEFAIDTLKHYKDKEEVTELDIKELDIIDRLLCSDVFNDKIIEKIKDYGLSLKHCLDILNNVDVQMTDHHEDYANYTVEDEKRYFLICDLEKLLIKEIDTNQPLALWEIQKHFISMIENLYEKENNEMKFRYRNR